MSDTPWWICLILGGHRTFGHTWFRQGVPSASASIGRPVACDCCGHPRFKRETR